MRQRYLLDLPHFLSPPNPGGIAISDGTVLASDSNGESFSRSLQLWPGKPHKPGMGGGFGYTGLACGLPGNGWDCAVLFDQDEPGLWLTTFDSSQVKSDDSSATRNHGSRWLSEMTQCNWAPAVNSTAHDHQQDASTLAAARGPNMMQHNTGPAAATPFQHLPLVSGWCLPGNPGCWVDQLKAVLAHNSSSMLWLQASGPNLFCGEVVSHLPCPGCHYLCPDDCSAMRGFKNSTQPVRDVCGLAWLRGTMQWLRPLFVQRKMSVLWIGDELSALLTRDNYTAICDVIHSVLRGTGKIVMLTQSDRACRLAT